MMLQLEIKGDNMRNIDIHCHILPGLDDGASSEKESLRMLKLAAKNGIKGVIATPHYSVGYPNLCPERIGSPVQN